MTTPTVDAIYNAAVDYATIKGYRLGNGADNDFRVAATWAANDVDAGVRTDSYWRAYLSAVGSRLGGLAANSFSVSGNSYTTGGLP